MVLLATPLTFCVLLDRLCRRRAALRAALRAAHRRGPFKGEESLFYGHEHTMSITRSCTFREKGTRVTCPANTLERRGDLVLFALLFQLQVTKNTAKAA